jgi:hypothetical protein
VRELEDERAIRELLARYGYNADTDLREKEWVALFTEDGVLDIGEAANLGENAARLGGVTRWEGHKGLWAHVNDVKGPTHFDGKGMHVQGNNVVAHIQGDEAVVDSYQFVLQGDSAPVQIITASNNQWRMKKIDGKWFFKERRRRHIGDPEFNTNLDATPE